jgi:DNA repair exonuclease SbcCD ATPase subunit
MKPLTYNSRGMRLAWIIVWLCLVGTFACKGKTDTSNDLDPAAVKAQQDLLKRRDALLEQRDRLETERREVVEQIKKVEASGGDTKDLAKKRDELTAQIDGQSAELGQMSDKISSLSTKLDSAAAIAIREDRMAQREGKIAAREATVSDRERAIALREERLAQREKETCSVATPVVIQQAPPKADGKYGKADVQPLLARARATMSKKGILLGDLPGPAQGLEAESTKAMAEGDWGKAYFAANQLVAMVDNIKVDRAFIQAKTARLSNQVKASKVDDAMNQQLSSTLADVMQKYNDGNFGAANQRLNQLAGMMK